MCKFNCFQVETSYSYEIKKRKRNSAQLEAQKKTEKKQQFF